MDAQRADVSSTPMSGNIELLQPFLLRADFVAKVGELEQGAAAASFFWAGGGPERFPLAIKLWRRRFPAAVD
jgi:hypothetical protein